MPFWLLLGRPGSIPGTPNVKEMAVIYCGETRCQIISSRFPEGATEPPGWRFPEPLGRDASGTSPGASETPKGRLRTPLEASLTRPKGVPGTPLGRLRDGLGRLWDAQAHLWDASGNVPEASLKRPRGVPGTPLDSRGGSWGHVRPSMLQGKGRGISVDAVATPPLQPSSNLHYKLGRRAHSG